MAEHLTRQQMITHIRDGFVADLDEQANAELAIDNLGKLLRERGYKIVPVEATDAMQHSFEDAGYFHGGYEALIAATPDVFEE